MIMMMYMYVLPLMLSTIMIMASIIMSKKSKEDQEKMSPFECGFDPMSSSRLPFSMRFFLITIIFLIFDVEIAIILPMIKDFDQTEIIEWVFSTIIFIMILIIGLIHEWNQGMLEWTQ